jgi:hypothetical protein
VDNFTADFLKFYNLYQNFDSLEKDFASKLAQREEIFQNKIKFEQEISLSGAPLQEKVEKLLSLKKDLLKIDYEIDAIEFDCEEGYKENLKHTLYELLVKLSDENSSPVETNLTNFNEVSRQVELLEVLKENIAELIGTLAHLMHSQKNSKGLVELLFSPSRGALFAKLSEQFSAQLKSLNEKTKIEPWESFNKALSSLIEEEENKIQFRRGSAKILWVQRCQQLLKNLEDEFFQLKTHYQKELNQLNQHFDSLLENKASTFIN